MPSIKRMLLTASLSPGVVNASTGFFTTLINVYTAKDGIWSVTAIATMVLISLILTVMATGLLVCSYFLRQLRS